jgi:two-component system, OmpR family, sensor histidine kinase KdpD
MARGRLRIYLGAAPGVGKTFAMLNEGWRRHERGSADVVVGFVESHGRANTAAQLHDLEIVPRRKLRYRDVTFEEMDVDAVLARKPQVALVDELAHTNVPGSRNEKRWQDVEELLEAGIEVISTVNVQHLESMNDVIEAITGIEQQEKIPDAIVRAADQIELVDMSPEALRRRMAHGNIYPPERVDTALGNYFREGNLGALRELALMWVADRVDEALERYREVHGITSTWETRERVVVAITGAPGGAAIIRRAARIAARTKSELVGVYVRPSDGLADGGSTEGLAEQRALLDELGARYHELASGDVAGTLVRFARSENATQIVLGATHRSRLAEFARGSVINSVIRASGAIDVHVISHGDEPGAVAGRDAPRLRAITRAPALSPRRRLVAWALALGGPILLTVVLSTMRESVNLPTDLLLFLLLAVVVAAIGGFWPAAVAAIGGFVLANWYFTPPLHSLHIGDGDNLASLTVFLVIAGVVSSLVSIAAHRTREAARARAHAETLAGLSGAVAASFDPLPELVAQLRDLFAADAVAVLHESHDGSWEAEAVSGAPTPTRPDGGSLAIPLRSGELLVVTGARVAVEDPDVLRAFAGQVAAATERRSLQAAAAHADQLAEANKLRTALLAAVSHDLRTPLASIKASVTSLLQRDIDWPSPTRQEFLETIDVEADRLNSIVGNLLDMSRLQTGSLELMLRAVSLDEVVAGAIVGLGDRSVPLEVDVAESLPPVKADAALLERAIANLVGNAIQWSPRGSCVRIGAGVVGEHVELQIVDRGPGIPLSERDRVFLPFQRLGDRNNATGVGLGLAVARGFVEVMGGELTVDDTPGGGLTMSVSLPVA